MEDTNRWVEKNWNASTLTYSFGGTKSRIQFKSFDSEGKGKASGKRDVLFINEANLTCIQHVSKSYTEVRQAQDKASLDEKAAANIDIDLLKLAKMLSVDINTINNDISK